MKQRYVLLFILLFALAIPAIGQTSSGNQEKAANIRRLLTMTGADKLQKNMIDQMLAALAPVITKTGQGDQQAQRVLGRMQALLTEELGKAGLLQITADLYDKYFTNDDIKALIQFYESPAGRKMIEMMPKLTEESARRGTEAGQKAAQKAIDRLVLEFPELKPALAGPAAPVR